MPGDHIWWCSWLVEDVQAVYLAFIQATTSLSPPLPPPSHRTSRDKREQPEEREHVTTLRVGRAIPREINKQDRRGKSPSSPRDDRMQSLVGHGLDRPEVYQNDTFSTLSLEDIKMPPKIVPGMISSRHSFSLSKASVHLPSSVIICRKIPASHGRFQLYPVSD